MNTMWTSILLAALLALGVSGSRESANEPLTNTSETVTSTGSIRCDYCSCVFTDDTPDEDGEEGLSAEDNRTDHLVRIVDCDNSGYWETCEHGIERATLRGESPKTKWVSCPGHPKNCGESPDDGKSHPSVRHVGERVAGAGEEE